MKLYVRIFLLGTLLIIPHVTGAEKEDLINEQEDLLEDVPDTSPELGTDDNIYSTKTYKAQHQDSVEKDDKAGLAAINLKNKDITMFFGGRIKDEFFFYRNIRTLRDDFHDQNDFFRHKLNLDWTMEQGALRYGKPASQAFVRLTNYIVWQSMDTYTPLFIEDLRNEDINLSLAKNTRVKSLMPLIFAEQAWFKINFDTFSKAFNKNPTFLKAGLFQYIVGRGITLGYHADLAVESLGWPGEGYFNRYPYMPPGILFRSELFKDFTLDLYYSKWREVNATLADTTLPVNRNRLCGTRPERGKDKDRDVWVIKADYIKETEEMGNWLAEPYWVYCRAPEQQIEFEADASGNIHTLGMMVDMSYNNFNVNVEVAGQLGYQQVHGIDRNEIRFSSDGSPVLSHVFFETTGNNKFPAPNNNVPIPNNISRAQVPVRSIQQNSINNPSVATDSTNNIDFIVNQKINRSFDRQGERIRNLAGGDLKINPGNGQANTGNDQFITNSNAFGNKRFRCPYKLDYRGVMALLDITYTFEDLPLKLAGAAGYIGGDEYPYNEEVSRTHHGFVPLRSWYKGHAVENIFIFDRLVLPRPMNISHRTLYSFNHLKNLSDLQYLGFGFTWHPLKERHKLSLTTDIMALWKVGEMPKWDRDGKHPDPAIEAQIALDRKLLNFKGWESNSQLASKMLGVETDIKLLYKFLDHCNFLAKFAIFIPGQLYRDIEGQPNILTRRIDENGRTQYEGLGSNPAFAFICGLDYRF